MTRIRYEKINNDTTLKSTKPILVGSNLLDILINYNGVISFMYADTTTTFHSFKSPTLAQAKNDVKKWLQLEGVVFQKETRNRIKPTVDVAKVEVS